jgi:hypothetical protein
MLPRPCLWGTLSSDGRGPGVVGSWKPRTIALGVEPSGPRWSRAEVTGKVRHNGRRATDSRGPGDTGFWAGFERRALATPRTAVGDAGSRRPRHEFQARPGRVRWLWSSRSDQRRLPRRCAVVRGEVDHRLVTMARRQLGRTGGGVGPTEILESERDREVSSTPW